MSEPLWTAQEIAAATGGQVSQDFAATGVSIDSRSIEPGDLFVALTGARDGHEFVVQTNDKGAAGALVSKPVAVPAVLIYNFFLRRLKLASADMDDFAHDFDALASRSAFSISRQAIASKSTTAVREAS